MSLLVPYNLLHQFCADVFKAIGCSQSHALTASTSLLRADIRGVDSHGIARLTGYVRLWKTNRVNTNPYIKITHQTPSTATLDADSALGLVAAPEAMEIAIQKAKQVGSGWVAVSNSNHFGIAGHYAMMALPHDMIGIAMTNASALVAPTFSTEKMLGTNPIAFAVPAKKYPAFVADFATTTAANGKLELLQKKNLPTPTGWVQDKHGNHSTDAAILKHEGALLPLGGDREHSSHKGYALGSMVDILCGVLSGANYGPWVPPFPAYIPMPLNMPGKGLGHFFGAFSIDAFRPADEFLTDMDNWIAAFKQAKTIQGYEKVIIPGEPEFAFEQQRTEHGIPIALPLWEELQNLAVEFKISPLEERLK